LAEYISQFFGVNLFGKGSEPDDVREHHRQLAAFSCRTGTSNSKGSAAVATKFKTGGVFKSAGWAKIWKRCAALSAELNALRILKITFWTAHVRACLLADEAGIVLHEYK
jgi:hypothetical protein